MVFPEMRPWLLRTEVRSGAVALVWGFISLSSFLVR